MSTMEEQSLETLHEEQETLRPKKKPPTFLRVISIIAIGLAAWGVLSGLFELIGSGFEPVSAEQLSENPEFVNMEEMDELDMMVIDPDVDYVIMSQYNYYSQWLAVGGGILTIILVLGMMRRKKAAFYPYVVTKLLESGVILYVLSQAQSESLMMTIFWGLAIGGLVHNLVFIFMFSRNLKHMS